MLSMDHCQVLWSQDSFPRLMYVWGVQAFAEYIFFLGGG